MSTHKVDFTVGAETVTTLIGHVTGLTQTLGLFVVGMQERDRKRLRRMGGKSEQFTMQALELAKANAAFIPATIDLAALERDKAAREVLLPIYMQLVALTKQLSDTLELCGVDLIAGALDCYKSLKFFGKAAGLEQLAGDLGKGFARPSRTTKKPAPAPAAPAPQP